MPSDDTSQMSFWDHLEALRGTLWHSLLAVLVMSAACFIFKDFVFDTLVLAPLSPDFFPYRVLKAPENIIMVNLEISGQFMVHMRVAFMLGFIASVPYIIWEIWRFIAPALYPNERRHVGGAFLLASGFFYFGAAVGYFILMPACLSFFQSYTVSSAVANTFSLQSYMSLFSSMVLLLGLVFEFPLLLSLLARLGVLNVAMLRKGRRYAIVAVLIVAAVITPADLGSMIIVSIPLYALYELSILMCRGVATNKEDKEVNEESPS